MAYRVYLSDYLQVDSLNKLLLASNEKTQQAKAKGSKSTLLPFYPAHNVFRIN